MYEKCSTFLRVEVCVNRMKDHGLHKGLQNLECLRQKLVRITDRLAGFEAQSLNVHLDLLLLQRMALPVMAGKTKIAGVKIHDTRLMRLREVLLHGGVQLNGWRSADLPQAILTTFGPFATSYTGTRAALMFILFHKRVCGPLGNSLFITSPTKRSSPPARSSRLPQGRSRHSTGPRSGRLCRSPCRATVNIQTLWIGT
jgi:hypothetical protein